MSHKIDAQVHELLTLIQNEANDANCTTEQVFSGVADLGKWLVILKRLADITSVTEPYTTPVGLGKRLDLLLDAGDAAASLTPTTADDKFWQTVRKVRNKPGAMDFIASLLADIEAGQVT